MTVAEMMVEGNVTQEQPKRKRTKRETVPFSSIHVTFAKRKGIDVTRAAKLNRSYIRSNFDTLAKSWPELRHAQKVNRDGNRYPQTIPVRVADAIVKRSLSPTK